MEACRVRLFATQATSEGRLTIGSLVIFNQYNAAIGFASLLWTVVMAVFLPVIASVATNLEIIAANAKPRG